MTQPQSASWDAPMGLGWAKWALQARAICCMQARRGAPAAGTAADMHLRDNQLAHLPVCVAVAWLHACMQHQHQHQHGLRLLSRYLASLPLPPRLCTYNMQEEEEVGRADAAAAASGPKRRAGFAVDEGMGQAHVENSGGSRSRTLSHTGRQDDEPDSLFGKLGYWCRRAMRRVAAALRCGGWGIHAMRASHPCHGMAWSAMVHSGRLDTHMHGHGRRRMVLMTQPLRVSTPCGVPAARAASHTVCLCMCARPHSQLLPYLPTAPASTTRPHPHAIRGLHS